MTWLTADHGNDGENDYVAAVRISCEPCTMNLCDNMSITTASFMYVPMED